MSIRTHRTIVVDGERRQVPVFSPNKAYSMEEIARRVRVSLSTTYNWRNQVFAAWFGAKDERIPTLLEGRLAQYLIENGKNGKPYTGTDRRAS